MLDTSNDYEQHFTGDGTSKTFDVEFVVFREADIVVLVDEEPYGYGFTVAGIGNYSGFSVELAVAPAEGADVAILSRPELIRDTDYQLNGDILAEELNRDLDRLWQGLQITDAVVQEAQENAANSESAATASAASAAASASSASSAAASAAALSTLQSGTPTNEAIAEGNTVQDALWRLQGQIAAQHSIVFVDLTGGDCTMTAAETAAPIIIFHGTPTGSVAVTSTSSVNTVGAHYIFNTTNEIVVLDGTVELGKHFSGVVVAMNDGAGFSGAIATEPAQPPAVEMSGTSYNVNDLQAGVYYYFTNASAVNLTVQTNSTKAIRDNAEFYFRRRGAGDLTLVEGTDGVDTVDIIPPKGGSLILEDGDFCTLKRTAVDVFDLVGSTQ